MSVESENERLLGWITFAASVGMSEEAAKAALDGHQPPERVSAGRWRFPKETSDAIDEYMYADDFC